MNEMHSAEKDAPVIEIQACQMRAGDVLLGERFGSTSGIVRRLAQPTPGDPSVGFYLGTNQAPRWFDPEEIVRVERVTPPAKCPNCKGTGEEFYDFGFREQSCTHCQGTGRVYPPAVTPTTNAARPEGDDSSAREGITAR